MSLLLVSTGVLLDKQERLLITQRPIGKVMAGLWEFPGGKIENKETPEQALIRELDEEINLKVNENDLYPLTFISYKYIWFHLLMMVYICRDWKGKPQPRETQAAAWVSQRHLPFYSLLPANTPIISRIKEQYWK